MNLRSALKLLPCASSRKNLSSYLRFSVFSSLYAICVIATGCGSGSSGAGTQSGPPKIETPPANLSYPQASIVARVGTAITADTPTVTGTVSSYTIAPALPAGLSIDATSGAISGTPTAASAQTAYTVTAINGGGSTTAQVQVKVLNGPSTLVNLGHTNAIGDIQMDGTHVLSTDANGHWVLWDYASRGMIASGDGAGIPDSPDKYIAIAGAAMAIIYQTNLNLYSTTDGHLLLTVPAGNWFKLASDGSYVAVGSPSGLAVYSAAGTLAFTRAGNYSGATAFAAPAQVRVANGPAGNNVIESIDIPTGSSSIGMPFAGTFNSWFNDGQRFLTRLDGSSTTTVLTYSASSVQQGVLNLNYLPYRVTNLLGQGDWISFVGADVTATSSTMSLYIYAIGSPTAAQAIPLTDTLYDVMSSGSELLISSYGFDQLIMIDLSGSNPTETAYTLPSPLHFAQNFAANSASEWVLACNDSVLVDGASISTSPRLFNYGAAASIVAAGDIAALATQSGQVMIYDVKAPALKGSIPLFATKLAISTDGTLLAGANLGNLDGDRDLHFYSLPSMMPTNTLSIADSSGGTPGLLDFSLSASGTEVGVLAGPRACCTGIPNVAELMHQDGTGMITLAVAGPKAPLLSPDGTLAVVSNSAPAVLIVPKAQLTIYKDGLPTTTKSDALAEGWINNSDLLVAEFAPTELGSLYPYLNSAILNDSGATTAMFKANQLPVTAIPSFIQGGYVYIPDSNSIYSLSTGDTAFQGPSDSLRYAVGAASASMVVYESTNGTVRIEPFQ